MAKAIRSRPSEASGWSALALGSILGAASLCLGCVAPADAAPAPAGSAELVVEVAWQNDVSLGSLKSSVHAKLDCSACHLPKRGDPDATKSMAGEVQCRGCHAKAEAAYDESIHGKSHSDGKQGAARCQDCHGAHDVKPVADPQSPVSKRRLPATCARCHDNPLFKDKIRNGHGAVRHYAGSIHGEKLLAKGAVTAPSCVDCHGSHEIVSSKDPSSKVSRANVVATCGECHGGIVRTFEKSVHGQALSEGDPAAPVCTSCHSAHDIDGASVSFKLASDQRCGKCHEQRFAQHLGTYHGRAHALGGSEVAACFDCHGSHDTLSSKDPASRVSAQNKLTTCRSCHANAPANFAGYLAHGSAADEGNYPLLWWTARPFQGLLWGAVLLFALHTLGWSVRSAFDFVSRPRHYLHELRRRRLQHEAIVSQHVRGVDKLCHLLLLASFLILVATGMPLKFHQTEWARAFFALLGGADVARAVHKLGASMTFAYVVIHFASVLGPTWRARAAYSDARGQIAFGRLLRYAFRPASPLLGPSDLAAFWKHVRWFLGRGPEPVGERYHYWEKLDYLAILVGISVVGFTGLVTWAPETFTRVLPGWTINFAQAVHSGEALIAAAFLLIVHLFHLLPKRFGVAVGRRETAVRRLTPALAPALVRASPDSARRTVRP